MAVEILMPQLGMYMVEGTLVRWLVPSCTSVKAGDAVLEIENEKATTEIVAPADGVVEQVAAAGEIVPVRGVLGRVLGASEMRGACPERSRRDGVGADASRDPAATQAAPAPMPASSPAGEVKASPLARQLAAQHGINLATLVGTGPGGRIGEADVRAAIERQAAPARDLTPKVLRRVSLSGRRKVIAQRMMASLANAAQLTVMREVDASALVQARETLVERAQELGLRVSYDALLAKALAAALKEQPRLNAVMDGDAIQIFEDVNVGIAMATPEGLVVPVVRGAQDKSLLEIARLVDDYSRRAASGKLLPDEMAGGTVTITNIGLFGVDRFTPILNPPESAILGVGQIASRPWVIGDGLFVRPTVHLSLTWDHRVADGAEAAQLVGRVAELMADRDDLANPAKECVL